MADAETVCKVNHVGVWYEDTFTDEVMKNIAAHSQVEKGKKVKLTLNKDGIKISKSKIFQQNLVEFYPYQQIKAVTKNPRLGNCIMFIMDGKEKKYKIFAVKCPSDSNAIYIVNRASQFRENARVGNVEFRKRENGNWTLRDRSAHNANMHLKEVFKEHQEMSSNGDTTILNGDVNHVPVLDKSREAVRTSTYIKRNGTVTRESVVVPLEDRPGKIHEAVKDEGITDAEDLKDLMEHAKIADTAFGGSRRGSMLPSKPVISTAPQPASGPVILRAVPKSYDARMVVPADPYYSRLAAHRRVSGDFVLPARLDRKYSSGMTSVRGGSMRVQFDTESIVSVPRKTVSMRIRPVTAASANFSTPTTIQRSIENTYGRPVVIQQRRPSGNAIVQGSRLQRPASVHVMGGNDLKVYKQGTAVLL